MKRIIAAVFFLIMGFSFAHGASPLDDLRGPIDQIITVLRDPQYKDGSKKEEQRQEIWKITEKIFDFRKIGELALGKYRKNFNEKQTDEFTKVFSDLLSNTYMSKIQGEYHNEQVSYLNEKIEKDKAVVTTHIIRENIKIPVDYSMWFNNNVWRIYDVKIEGVSIVKNYRTQFQSILENKPPDHLISQLKEKLKKQNKGGE